ncbi:gas vesicle protein GvpO [Pseudorhodobacter sp. MZDSW-24AT]|uniref:gas vesicle protein GvpO n=1 Tax=Pseudorhodobacter sp. MZDSW-24AT TaxID=2052957 RepID=UPI000C1E535C|nr:gas vesicle protein GvpO [Pseudorhodobacter sp. MZDSW-24AT]PJF08881.1 gas vesicle protein [Pseudorhodobacter sp. MZDSW-24AT]
MMHEESAIPGQSKESPSHLTMRAAIGIARDTVASLTVLSFDSVGQCERCADGRWMVQIDVIESPARMGDNDLLATYEVEIGDEGEPLKVSRLRRYHREDEEQA